MRRFLEWNRKQSSRLEGLLLQSTARRPGLSEFQVETIPALLKPGLRILDVGGGKQPLIDAETRLRLGLHITGLDIDADELRQAPTDSYDETLVRDVADGPIPGEYDLILSRTVLEHVRDTPTAISVLSRSLAPGGTMAHFLPCRNAPFARINLLVGNRIARKLLKLIWSTQDATNGFPAYYNRCTPRQLGRLCETQGLDVVETRPYFASTYLRFLVPLHALDVTRQLTLMWLGAHSLCETFTVIARRPELTASEQADRAAA